MRQFKIVKSITDQEKGTLGKYLQEIGREELITAEEEVELAQRIKRGDQKAREKMIIANLRFVVSVAKQYQNQGMPLPDLVNEGNIGLIKAAERFDETRGFKFISFAVWWIRQAILMALADQSRLIRLPLNKIGKQNKISKLSSTLEQEREHKPTSYELSERINLSEYEITEILSFANRHLSMDAPLVGDEEYNLNDVLCDDDSLAPDKGLIDESLRKEIERSIQVLKGHKHEEEVICMFFGLRDKPEMSFDEIAEGINLSHERVRQIKEKAIKRLRTIENSKLLRKFLG